MAIRVPEFAVKAEDIYTPANPTRIKRHPSRHSSDADLKFSGEDLPLLVTKIDRDLTHTGTDRNGENFEWIHSHWEVELAVPMDGQYNWFLFHEHVEEGPLPEFFIQGGEDTPTIIKHHLNGNLAPDDKFNFNEYKQPLQAKRIWHAGDSHHIGFELIKPINGKYNWFAYLEHVVPSKIGTRVSA